jgi:hypothetical protein
VRQNERRIWGGEAERAWEKRWRNERTFRPLLDLVSPVCALPSGSSDDNQEATPDSSNSLPFSLLSTRSVAAQTRTAELTAAHLTSSCQAATSPPSSSSSPTTLSSSSRYTSFASSTPTEAMSTTPEGPCAVCGEVTTKRCGPCAKHSYSLYLCCPEHQKLVSGSPPFLVIFVLMPRNADLVRAQTDVW